MKEFPDDKRRRLVQLLGMMGSAHDGEVLNAAKMAQRLLGSLEMTWEEAVGSRTVVQQNNHHLIREAYDTGYVDGRRDALAEARSDVVPVQSWPLYAAEVLDRFELRLTEWEIGFLENFADRGWEMPTPKQYAVFQRIARKTGLRCPEYA